MTVIWLFWIYDQPQNLTDSFDNTIAQSYKVSWKSLENCWCNPANKQTNKRTDAGDYIVSVAERLRSNKSSMLELSQQLVPGVSHVKKCDWLVKNMTDWRLEVNLKKLNDWLLTCHNMTCLLYTSDAADE